MRWESPSERTQLILLSPVLVPICVAAAPIVLVMAGLIKLREHLLPKADWHSWYAWRPVQHYRDRTWHWLEPLERRRCWRGGECDYRDAQPSSRGVLIMSSDMVERAPSDDVEREYSLTVALIDAIISAYHTTRLLDTPAAKHILSKPRVQAAFAALTASRSYSDEIEEGVTQEDREAAARLYAHERDVWDGYSGCSAIREGCYDEAPIVQAFRAHRVSALSKVKDQV